MAVFMVQVCFSMLLLLATTMIYIFACNEMKKYLDKNIRGNEKE